MVVKKLASLAAVASVVALVASGTAAEAQASIAPVAPAGPVSTTPAGFTPYLNPAVPSQTVYQMAQCGGTMYAVGHLSSIRKGGGTYVRNNAFSFSATTGQLTNWDPNVNGTVRTIALSSNCARAFIGGSFTSVNGTAVQNIASVNTTTSLVNTNFAHAANSTVFTLHVYAGKLLAGGMFSTINGASRSHLASLNTTTGAPTPYLNLTVTGTYPGSSPTKVSNSQVSHDGTRMLVEGVFTSIGGQPRQQVAMLDLRATSATVDAWHSTEFDDQCESIESFYTHSANWSPDDATVYVATTGYKPAGGSTGPPRTGLCDAVAAFPSNSTTVSHAWVNYAGCDSLYSVVADANDVYIGGHQRYADNENGCDYPAPPAVERMGIGSIDPVTGRATSWNPTRSRGHGSEDLLLTSAGLWISSDNYSDGQAQYCGGVGNHGGICFLPY